MTIFFYILKKYIFSFFVSIFCSMSIFFIFSLIGYLGESISFSLILILSLISSLQIFTFIPSYILVLSIFIFVTILKSKNELIIIKEYLTLKKTIILFMPLIFFFTIFEINKSLLSEKIELTKSKLINLSNKDDLKVLVSISKDIKDYYILKNVDKANDTIEEYLSFKVSDQSIIYGNFSNKVFLKDDAIFSDQLFKYEDSSIREVNYKLKLFDEFKIFITNLNTHIKINYVDSSQDNLEFMNKLIFYFLFYLCILIIFLSKKLVLRNNKLNSSLYLVVLLVLYNLIITQVELNNINHIFHLLSSIILYLTFQKIKKYE